MEVSIGTLDSWKFPSPQFISLIPHAFNAIPWHFFTSQFTPITLSALLIMLHVILWTFPSYQDQILVFTVCKSVFQLLIKAKWLLGTSNSNAKCTKSLCFLGVSFLLRNSRVKCSKYDSYASPPLRRKRDLLDICFEKSRGRDDVSQEPGRNIWRSVL